MGTLQRGAVPAHAGTNVPGSLRARGVSTPLSQNRTSRGSSAQFRQQVFSGLRTILFWMVGILDQVEIRFHVPLYKEKSVPHAGGDEPYDDRNTNRSVAVFPMGVGMNRGTYGPED